MGILRTNKISGLGTDGTVFQGVTRFDTQGYFVAPSGTTDQRNAGITTTDGTIRFNTDSQKLEFYAQSQWWEMVIDTPNLAVGSDTGAGARGVYATGYTGPGGTGTNVIDYINISSTGNAIDFGDTSSISFNSFNGQISSSTRGLIKFGSTGPSPSPPNNTVEYVTISSTGNSLDFGDVQQFNGSGCSNSTRGIFAGGYSIPASARVNTIEYVTISSTGNAIDFGDLTQVIGTGVGMSSPTRGIFAGGRTTSGPTFAPMNSIEYITISTLGNSTDFGDLTNPVYNPFGCSNATRGVIGGGNPGPVGPAQIYTSDYITLSTLGNAVRFGTLANFTSPNATNSGNSASSSTRGVFLGGYTPQINQIQYFLFANQGDAIDFGDLTVGRRSGASFSNAHGGL